MPATAAQLSANDRQRLRPVLQEFDASWHDQALPDFAARLAGARPNYSSVALIELVKLDLRHRWKAGQPRRIEEYFQQFPQLTAAELTLPLIVAELEVRGECGWTIDLEEVRSRFPGCLAGVQQWFSQKQSASSAASTDTNAPRAIGDTLDAPGKDSSPLPDQFGRYRIEKRLGQGAMGAVYLAFDTQLERCVALKTPSFRGDRAPEMVQRFYREARAAATLRHPHICPVFDVGEIGGIHFIAMAYIEGRPLADYIRSGNPIPPRSAALTVRKLALALAHAHAHGVVHRDLKPANIMIDRSNEPVVTDFGLARRDASPGDSRATQTGVILGTPAYMSPEQVEGDPKKIGPHSDIYSLGVVFYELLTGRLPFDGSVGLVLGKIMSEEPRSPCSLRSEVDPQVAAMCLKMMARRPDARYGSMQEVAAALTAWLKESPQLSPKETLGGPASTASIRPPAAETLVPPPLAARETEKISSATGVDILPAPRPLPPRIPPSPDLQRTRTLASIAAGVAVLLLVALGIVLLVRTPDGIVRIETDADFVVSVDGRQIQLTSGMGEVSLPPGKEHTLGVQIGQTAVPLGRTVQLSTGKYNGHFQLAVKAEDATLTAKGFTFTQGARPVMRVSLVESSLAAMSMGNASSIAAAGARVPAPAAAADVAQADVAPAAAIAPFDSAQARRHQEAWAKYLQLPVEYTNTLGMQFVLIPPGEFLMGSTQAEMTAELGAIDTSNHHWREMIRSEFPQHQVILTKPIYLSVQEVSQRDYAQLMGTNPSQFSRLNPDASRYPVDSASWNDATEFCRKLSTHEKVKPEGRYRLPREAEWEFACRAGTTTRYFRGDRDQDLGPAGWFADNSGGKPTSMGQLQVNPFGLYDMHGNVWEWVQDNWSADYYAAFANRPTIDPSGTVGGNERVLKSGGFNATPSGCRSASREFREPARSFSSCGFRVVLSIDSERLARK